MGFTDAISTCLKKYFTMSGRAPRSEFWWFQLGMFLFSVVTALIDTAMFGFSPDPGPIEVVGSLLVLCPSLTVSVRRLHDIDRAGWWILSPLPFMAAGIGFGAAFGATLGTAATIGAGCIMLAGVLLLLWWYIRPSQPGPNRYGPNPLEVTP